MAVGAHLQPCTPIRKYVYINLHELLKCLCTFIIKFIIMQVIKYIYSLSMLVPSSAYLLQPFILKLILRGPSQSILGCFAGCVRSRRGYVCGEHISVWVWLGMCVRGNTYCKVAGSNLTCRNDRISRWRLTSLGQNIIHSPVARVVYG